MTAAGGSDATARDRFTVLYESHYWDVVRYAYRRLGGDDDEARDAAADTFTAVWRRLDDVPENALPWLYGVARRVVANRRRGRRRARALYDRLQAELGREVRASHATAEPVVLTALRGLSERDREVLRLTSWEGLAGDALASALNCTPNAAAVRLHRARSRLRARLGSLGAATRSVTTPPSTSAEEASDHG